MRCGEGFLALRSLVLAFGWCVHDEGCLALRSLAPLVCCGTVASGSAQSCARGAISLMFFFLRFVGVGEEIGPDFALIRRQPWPPFYY